MLLGHALFARLHVCMIPMVMNVGCFPEGGMIDSWIEFCTHELEAGHTPSSGR